MYGMTDAQNQEMKVQDVDMKEATNFLGYIQAQKTGGSLTGGSSPSSQASFMNSSFSTDDISGDED